MSAHAHEVAAVTVDAMLEAGWTRAGDHQHTGQRVVLEHATPRQPSKTGFVWSEDPLPPEDLVRATTWRAPTLDAAALHAEVERVQAKARARTLDLDDVEWFCLAVKRCRAYAKRHGLNPLSVTVTVTGGFVPNSYSQYGRRAEATWLRYQNGEVSVLRGWAQSRAGGRGETHVAKVRDPSHKSTGRCRKAGGFAFPLERGS